MERLASRDKVQTEAAWSRSAVAGLRVHVCGGLVSFRTGFFPPPVFRLTAAPGPSLGQPHAEIFD